MAESWQYDCICWCGCDKKVKNIDDVCEHCQKKCKTAESEQTEKAVGSFPGNNDFCSYCDNRERLQKDHCVSDACQEKCTRHQCLWACGVCAKCCCFCRCQLF